MVEEVIADVVRDTSSADFSKLSIRGTVEIAVRLAVLLICTEAHRSSTIGTADKSCENLRGRVFLLSATAGDLFLYLYKDLLGDDCFVGVLHHIH